MEHVAWLGHLPVMRGGVATFTLQAAKPFALTLQADPNRSASKSFWHLLASMIINCMCARMAPCCAHACPACGYTCMPASKIVWVVCSLPGKR